MLVAWDMNQHLILCWVSQPNLLNLRFCPPPPPRPPPPPGGGGGGGGGGGQNAITLRKRRLKKMATQKYALPKYPKRKT